MAGRGKRLEAGVDHARGGISLEEPKLVSVAAEPEGVAVLRELRQRHPFVLADHVIADQPPGCLSQSAARHLPSPPLREEPAEGQTGYSAVKADIPVGSIGSLGRGSTDTCR